MFCVIIDYNAQRNRKFKNVPRLVRFVIVAFIGTYAIFTSFYICEFSFYSVYRVKAFKVSSAYTDVIKALGPAYSLVNAVR